WWMVSSGLADRIHVSHDRLAFHFALACVIYAAIVWTASRLRPATAAALAPARLRVAAYILIVVSLLQFYLGALVAGLRAALVYNAWPLMAERFIPRAADLFFASPFWINFIENAMTVQFDHRMVGYVLCLVALVHLFDGWRTKDRGED